MSPTLLGRTVGATVCEGEVELEGVFEDDMEGVSFSQSVSQYESYSM